MHRGWSTWSARHSSRWTGSPPRATRSSPMIDNHHGGSPALMPRWQRSPTARTGWPSMRAWTRCAGRGWSSRSTTRSATQRAASHATPPRRPGGAPAGHRGGAQRAVERGRRRASRCRISGSSARRRRGASATRYCSTVAPTARRTSLPRSATLPPCRRALAASPLVTLYKQYVVRFGLGYTEVPQAPG